MISRLVRRADALLRWLADRPEQILLLTETSGGDGSAYLLDQFRRAGCHVQHPPLNGDRGAAMISRIPVTARPDVTAGLSVPGRVVAATVGTDPPVTVLGVYVPSSDRAPAKVERNGRSWPPSPAPSTSCPSTRCPSTSGHIWCSAGTTTSSPATTSRPTRGYGGRSSVLFDALTAADLTEAHAHLALGVQQHSWFGRAGNGYRFDYLHTGAALRDRLRGGGYLQEPREQGLTDHSAVTVDLDLPIDTPGVVTVSQMPAPATLF